jgi:hypothetical protein
VAGASSTVATVGLQLCRPTRLRILKTGRVYQRYSVSLGLVNALNYCVLCYSGRLKRYFPVLSR